MTNHSSEHLPDNLVTSGPTISCFYLMTLIEMCHLLVTCAMWPLWKQN